MPVVDSYACINSRDGVAGYLNVARDIHVLRMVAVSGAQITSGFEELDELQRQTKVPGLGGFPNAIVAQCCLSEPETLLTLLQSTFNNLRGIKQPIERLLTDSKKSDINAAIALLDEHAFCLDLDATKNQLEWLQTALSLRPGLLVVVNLPLAEYAQENSALRGCIDQLNSLSVHDQLHIKLSAGGLTPAAVTGMLEDVLPGLLARFGDERVMFGSGPIPLVESRLCVSERKHALEDDTQSGNNPVLDSNVSAYSKLATFDELWRAYMRVCEHCSARTRDKLFRSNALRLYRI